jgi:DNA-binding GntR family transcriptional regulator
VRPSRHQTAHEYALAQLRSDILSGALAPGQRLRQADLAVQLGISTTPVREALRDLATEGLVKFDSHRGAEVMSLDLGEVRDLLVLRAVLEPFAMRSACERITAAELDEAAGLVAGMDDEDDLAVWLQLNREFHDVLQRAARIPVLEKTLRLIQDQTATYLARAVEQVPDRPKAGQREHRELLEALRRKQGDRAADVARRHVQFTLEMFNPDVGADRRETVAGPG